MHGEDPRARPREFRVLGLVLLLALGLAGLTACDDGEGSSRPDTFEYVALGDSFAATGIGVPQDTKGCKRSKENYPQLLAKAHPDWVVLDVSCGGADSADMTRSQELNDGTVSPPQFDALDEGTDLVTVSLGGNDFDVYWAFLYRCTQVANLDPDGAPCRRTNKGTVEGRMPAIRERLTAVLEQVAERSPDARVLFVGYPRLLPDDGACPGHVPVAAGDADYVREMMGLLVQAQHEAAEKAGVEYVDLYTPSEGHDICSDRPWINDFTDGPEGAYNFHPMPALQVEIRDLVEESL